jgi:hypothetical protein
MLPVKTLPQPVKKLPKAIKMLPTQLSVSKQLKRR